MSLSSMLSANIKVMVVEDHGLVSDGIENLLTSHFDMQVVSRINNGLDVYKTCQQNLPNLVLMDLCLPGMSGLDVIERLKKRWPDLCIVVLTAQDQQCVVHQAIAAGVQAYVLKQSNRYVLFAALKSAIAGMRFIDPALNIKVSSVKNSLPEKESLTKREKQTLKLISEGNKNSDIAEKLSISLKTVETHRLNLMKKLDAHNVAELIMRSRSLGLVLL